VSPPAAAEVEPGTLYVVATPIGNLGDITYRAIMVLRDASLVVAEDTRHSRTLLSHYGITTPMSSYHEHNEAREAPRLVARLAAGESIALVTDAGTPLVSDPGARLVRAAVDAGVPVVPIPGASALLAALVGSALSAERFTFIGFLARKGRERDTELASIARSPYTVVLYESPHRVGATLRDLARAGCAERHAVIARELTKRYEEFRRGTVRSLADALGDVDLRGEVAIVIAGLPAAAEEMSEEAARAEAQRLLAAGNSPRTVVQQLSEGLGIPRNVAYRLAHEPPERSAAEDGADD
jgi:16S rRNA (cytidine1402-2'-O)-methyltransferase